MRANVYCRRENGQPFVEDRRNHLDGPRCFIHPVNRRRFKQSLCTLASVFFLAIAAYVVSYYYYDQADTSVALDLKLIKDMEYLQCQITELAESCKRLKGSREVGSKMAAPGDNKIMGIIKSELMTYDADKTGIADYALETSGACIASTKNTHIMDDDSTALTLLGFAIWTFKSSPTHILQPSMQPGQCWSFQGKGEVIIKLMYEVIINAVSIEHISRGLLPSGDISTAPKDFELLGLTDLDDTQPHSYGSFVYDADGPPLQMFQVMNPTKRSYEIVEIHFNSNHGNDLYTCVYRVRIHGKPQEIVIDTS